MPPGNLAPYFWCGVLSLDFSPRRNEGTQRGTAATETPAKGRFLLSGGQTSVAGDLSHRTGEPPHLPSSSSPFGRRGGREMGYVGRFPGTESPRQRSCALPGEDSKACQQNKESGDISFLHSSGKQALRALCLIPSELNCSEFANLLRITNVRILRGPRRFHFAGARILSRTHPRGNPFPRA